MSGAAASGREVLHASAVAVGERAVLIAGGAGSGKTNLALRMIALGAELVADDCVEARPDGAGAVWLSAPDNLAGLAEVRGFGLIRLPWRRRARLALIADLDQAESARLPARRERVVGGISCPLILCEGMRGRAAVLTCLLRAEEWPGPEFLAGR